LASTLSRTSFFFCAVLKKNIYTHYNPQTVVVGDSKSPLQHEWSQGHCIYLSLKEQHEALDYRVVAQTPTKSYTRKNIGYLYAIHHGAQVIFDTDDDNRPRGNHVHELKEDMEDVLAWYRNDSDRLPLGNVYAHYGHPDIWPRGYPLQPPIDLEHPVPTSSSPVQIKAPKDVSREKMVVQGLADLDPDVDAVFRLTRPEQVGKIRFCANVPAIRFEPGLYSPFNSQNTLFYKDTLWSLLLPKTVSFRVCDIWRAYWAQRLLWDVGGRLVFQGSTVDQVRNLHNLLEDRDEEKSLYEDAERFVALLDGWMPTTASLSERMIELAELMVANTLLAQGDVELMRAWVADLDHIGYVFPSLVTATTTAPAVVPPVTTAVEIPERMRQRMHICGLRKAWSSTLHPIYKDVLLICHFNHIRDYVGIPMYLDFYSPAFPNIVFTGQSVDVSPAPYDIDGYMTYASTDPRLRGDSQHRGLVYMYKKHPNYNGYMWTNDDVFVDYWHTSALDQAKFWYFNYSTLYTETRGCYDVGNYNAPFSWHWHWQYEIHHNISYFRTWLNEKKQENFFLPIDPTVAQGNLCEPNSVPANADTFWMYHMGGDYIYMPHERLYPRTKQFMELMGQFSRVNIAFMEVATATSMLLCVPEAEAYAMKLYFNWGGRDARETLIELANQTVVEGFHSIKFMYDQHDALHTIPAILEQTRKNKRQTA